MIQIERNMSRTEIFDRTRAWLNLEGFLIQQEDMNRPWGGFFVLEGGSQVDKFRNLFFPEVSFSESQLKNKLSPKILLVAPEKRLSWQYHHRRSEIWKLIGGEGGIVTSLSDEEGSLRILNQGQVVELAQGERHRLVGLGNWGVVAEIWMHTDPENPSDEADIVRVQDDFQRT